MLIWLTFLNNLRVSSPIYTTFFFSSLALLLSEWRSNLRVQFVLLNIFPQCFYIIQLVTKLVQVQPSPIYLCCAAFLSMFLRFSIVIKLLPKNSQSIKLWYRKKCVQYCLNLRKILGVAKKFFNSRSFLFQTPQNP